jgi:malonate decarboxylase gamma subunit
MQTDALLDTLFPHGHAIRRDGVVLCGSGQIGSHTVSIVGTADGAAIGNETALRLADEVLRIIREHPGRPILLLVDTTGQRLSHRDELLGINRFLAHLAKCTELARLRGHRTISLVYAQGVSGGYLSWGMLADACFALPQAEIRVMGLPAMSRVTKIRQDILEELSETSPVFAPGVGNYLKMGALEALWESDLPECLADALSKITTGDHRREAGQRNGGRQQAGPVSRRVRTYVVE